MCGLQRSEQNPCSIQFSLGPNSSGSRRKSDLCFYWFYCRNIHPPQGSVFPGWSHIKITTIDNCEPTTLSRELTLRGRLGRNHPCFNILSIPCKVRHNAHAARLQRECISRMCYDGICKTPCRGLIRVHIATFAVVDCS